MASDLSTVSEKLATKVFGRPLRVVSRTRSTNDDARQWLESGGSHGSVVLADSQSAGRGSQGRMWDSPAGTDIYLSAIVHTPNLPMASLPPLTLAAGLAVARTLDTLVGEGQRVGIKWPNDVYIDEAKCAGLLLETTSQTAGCVVGIGLNVNRTSWPLELSSTATSLARTTGETFERASVAASLLLELEHVVEQFLRAGFGPMRRELENRLLWKDSEIRWESGPTVMRGVLRGVNADGSLLVETRYGEKLDLHSARIERIRKDEK